MKHQALFSSKDKSEKIKCRLLQILYVALRIKVGIPFIFMEKRKNFLKTITQLYSQFKEYL